MGSFEFGSLPYDRAKMEKLYGSMLAPYATHTSKSESRKYSDPGDNGQDNRSSFQRDRDRIIHSKAFRRLMYKTQVFVNHEGDHYRTRLTHTLEVAQFARGVCKQLGLNEELAEAIAPGHDLGHTPFGHAVERYLDDILREKNKTRFFHNEQSLRVVDYLETRTDAYKGLNLTYEVREGILKHNDKRSEVYKELNPSYPCETLEGQVVNIVDTIAYICHDLEDGLSKGLIEKSVRNNPDFAHGMNDIKELIQHYSQTSQYRDKEIIIATNPYEKRGYIKNLIHLLLVDLTHSSALNLKTYDIISNQDVAKKAEAKVVLIDFRETKATFEKLKKLIYQNVYQIHTIQSMDQKAVQVAKEMFELFSSKPALLPPEWLYQYNHLPGVDCGYANTKERVICDYIATMTDRFALDEHTRLFNPRIKI